MADPKGMFQCIKRKDEEELMRKLKTVWLDLVAGIAGILIYNMRKVDINKLLQNDITSFAGKKVEITLNNGDVIECKIRKVKSKYLIIEKQDGSISILFKSSISSIKDET